MDDNGMNKKVVIVLYKGILFSNEKQMICNYTQ